jgi:hypothetical protein
MATSSQNGKRRSLAASPAGGGDVAVLAAAAHTAEQSSAEMPPLFAPVVADEADAPPKINGARKKAEAPAPAQGSDVAPALHNGADGSSPESAVTQHRSDRALQGYIDEANATAIRGWAWDPKAPNECIRLELVEDDAPLLTVIAGESRPGLVLSGIGDGRHGFDIALAGGLLPEGRHVLHLRCAETGAPVPGSPIAIEGLTGVMTAHAEIDGDAAPAGWKAARNGAAEPAVETVPVPSIRPVADPSAWARLRGQTTRR